MTPDPRRDLVAEGRGSRETGPIGGIDGVFNRYGEDGREPGGLVAQARVNYPTGPSEGTPRTAGSEYRASFKRARP